MSYYIKDSTNGEYYHYRAVARTIDKCIFKKTFHGAYRTEISDKARAVHSHITTLYPLLEGKLVIVQEEH